MASTVNEKTPAPHAALDALSIRSTSTMSSLKQLLPKKKAAKEKIQTHPNAAEAREKAIRKEAAAAYMMMR